MCSEHARFGILPSPLSPESPSQPSVEAPAERCTSDPHGRPASAHVPKPSTAQYTCAHSARPAHMCPQCMASAHAPKPSIQPSDHLAHHLLICNRRKSHQRRRLCPRWAQLLQNSPLSANFIPRQRQTERACLLRIDLFNLIQTFVVLFKLIQYEKSSVIPLIRPNDGDSKGGLPF